MLTPTLPVGKVATASQGKLKSAGVERVLNRCGLLLLAGVLTAVLLPAAAGAASSPPGPRAGGGDCDWPGVPPYSGGSSYTSRGDFMSSASAHAAPGQNAAALTAKNPAPPQPVT